MTEIYWCWPWQNPSYRSFQGFWLWWSSIVGCKTKCIWHKFLHFLPHGSIVDPLLFNIYFWSFFFFFFFFIKDLDIVSYVDDNTPYTSLFCKKSGCAVKIFKWFHNNCLSLYQNNLNSKLKSKHGLPANSYACCVKIYVILVSFKLSLCNDFTILFNGCVLHLFIEWF